MSEGIAKARWDQWWITKKGKNRRREESFWIIGQSRIPPRPVSFIFFLFYFFFLFAEDWWRCRRLSPRTRQWGDTAREFYVSKWNYSTEKVRADVAVPADINDEQAFLRSPSTREDRHGASLPHGVELCHRVVTNTLHRSFTKCWVSKKKFFFRNRENREIE